MRKPSEKFFLRYEYLAKKYAIKLFNTHVISLDRDDIVQNLRIKLYEAILQYGRRWRQYQNNEKPKPMPIEFYLKLSMANKIKDYIKEINRESDRISFLPDDVDSFDYGVFNPNVSIINPDKDTFIINDIDLLEGLENHERKVFSLHLKGFEGEWIKKLYSKVLPELNTDTVIKRHLKKLRAKKHLIALEENKSYLVFNFLED